MIACINTLLEEFNHFDQIDQQYTVEQLLKMYKEKHDQIWMVKQEKR